MTQIYINDILIELATNDVSQTFQLGDIADISTRQTSYTNKFKVPRTPKNVETFNFLGIVGSEQSFNASQFPYGTPSAKVTEGGIELVSNGLAVISETNTDYEIIIYGSEKSFFEKVSILNLNDCYPDTSFTYTAANVANAFDRTSNYVFSLLYYNNFTRTHNAFTSNNDSYWFTPYVKLWTERMTPQFFIKSLFQNIFDFLGYTLINPISSNTRFTNMLTNASTSIMNFNINYGDTFNLKNLAPTMNCADFIKEIMIRFGLLIRVNELQKKVEFIRIDDLVSTSQVEDWSGKFSSFKKETYKLGNYARKNTFKVSADSSEEIQNEYVKSFYEGKTDDELIGSFVINSSQFDSDETDLFTSKFSKPKLVRYTKGEYIQTSPTDTVGVWEYFGSVYVGSRTASGSGYSKYYRQYHLIDLLEFDYKGNPNDDYNTIGNIPEEFTSQIFYNYKTGYTFQLKMRLPDGQFEDYNKGNINIAQYQDEYEHWTNGNSQGSVKSPLISFQIFLDENYPKTIRTLNKLKVVNCLMNLSVLDIYALDFFKRKYIKQLGGNFYLNKVNNFKLGKLTECEFVRIPTDFN